VIFDQGIKAEKAWTAPYILKQRLGHFDIEKIIDEGLDALTSVFLQKPFLHRFPRNMAKYIFESCILLRDKYSSDATNIWNDKPQTSVLQKRFEEFKGIGQKKASMATNIIVRDFHVPAQDYKGIDVSYDIHVRRVFLRTGLAQKDEMNHIVNVARKLSPDYPGVLDLPAWMIGRKFCHASRPVCDSCPLSELCGRIEISF